MTSLLLRTPLEYERGGAALDVALLNDQKVSEAGHKSFHACFTVKGVGWSVRLFLGLCACIQTNLGRRVSFVLTKRRVSSICSPQ